MVEPELVGVILDLKIHTSLNYGSGKLSIAKIMGGSNKLSVYKFTMKSSPETVR